MSKINWIIAAIALSGVSHVLSSPSFADGEEEKASRCGGAAQCPDCQAMSKEMQELRESLRKLEERVSQISPTTNPDLRKSKSGAVFTRDRSDERLGEAWRDPNGLIWGDLVRGTNGEPRLMTQAEATSYCSGLGGRLPSYDDYMRLRNYIGDETGARSSFATGFLPNTFMTGEYGIEALYFWSQTPHCELQDVFYVYGVGYLGAGLRLATEKSNEIRYAVRCVKGG